MISRDLAAALAPLLSWTPRDGDQFKWRRTDIVASPMQLTTESTVVVPGDHACIEVYLVRRQGETSPTAASQCGDR